MHKTYIRNRPPYTEVLRTEEAEPECGDYCDTCGDCLKCSGGDNCYHGGEINDWGHSWVEYVDD